MQQHLLREPLPGSNNLDFLAATLLDAPWVDAELPSLVAEDDDGRILGFIGVQPRRLTLDGAPIRAVCCSHLVVAPDARTTALGPRLVKHVLSGPQAMTWSDTGTEVVARMWKAFGGFVDPVRSLDWMLVLHGGRWLGRVVAAAARERGRPGRDAVPVGGVPLHALGRRLMRRAFPDGADGVAWEPASAAEVTRDLPAMARALRLRADYDEESLTAVLALVASAGGEARSATVRRAGRPIGWYVYLMRHGVARVLACLGDPREADATLFALAEDVRQHGGTALGGRLEPFLAEALSARMAVLGFARRPVIHVRDPAVRTALAEGSAALSLLDGEWWVT